MKVLVGVLAGGAITVVVRPQIPVPTTVACAIALAIALAIIVWTLWRGGTATVNRSSRGNLSFKLAGPRARRRAARRKSAAPPAKNRGSSAGGTPVHGTSDPYTLLSTTSSGTKVAGVFVAVLLVFGGLWAVSAPSHHHAAVKRPPPSVQTSAPAPPSRPNPATVIRDYFAAINRHDWEKLGELWAWKPGHRPSSKRIAAGFRLTKRDVVVKMKTSGDRVSVRVLAYETTGAVQTYAFSYVVHHGRITQGRGTLLSTRHPHERRAA